MRFTHCSRDVTDSLWDVLFSFRSNTKSSVLHIDGTLFESAINYYVRHYDASTANISQTIQRNVAIKKE